ncbi:16717_t:CDS:2, partial [Funneliformis mosseae]
RTRFFSNVLQHAIGSLTDCKLEKELQETEELQEKEELQETESQRDKNEDKEEDQGDETDDQKEKDQGDEKDDQKEKDQGDQENEKKDQIDVTSFKVEARNHNAHGITYLEGRWSDEKLQRLSTLALEVIVCLGDQEAFGLLMEIKRKLDTELIERLSSTRKRKHEEEDVCAKKRNLTNIEYGEFTDFALCLVSKLERNEKQASQIVRMVIDKNEVLVNVRKSLITQKDEDKKIKKFVALTNFQFDMAGSKPRGLHLCRDIYDLTDLRPEYW